MIHTEVCVDSWSGALAACEAGAHRIELCMELPVGGLTPTAGMLQKVCELPIEVVALIRPRAGDFVYDDFEVATMVEDITWARDAGAKGVAIGALLPDGSIDRDALDTLMRASHGLSVCFHRAFDGVADPMHSLQILGEAGVGRVLTSGLRQDVVAGLSMIRKLVQACPSGLEIMPGGGVRPENAAKVLRESGAKALHFSARVPKPHVVRHSNLTCDLHDPARQDRTVTNVQEIKRYLDAIRLV